MSARDSLGDRMKGYEVASRTVLPHRLPVIIRVDGKAFHTYTAECERPFDQKLSDVMFDTAKELCKRIQGAQLAYTQSDEISILVHGYKKFDSQVWFDGQVQKMASVAAGIASSHFTAESWRIWHHPDIDKIDAIAPAVFDARAFVVPEADVCNYFLWRQQDAMRNSVQMLARSMYSHRQCDGKNIVEMKQMILDKKDPSYPLGWESLQLGWQRGLTWRRPFTPDEVRFPTLPQYAHCQSNWTQGVVLFSEHRDYVNNLLRLEDEE